MVLGTVVLNGTMNEVNNELLKLDQSIFVLNLIQTFHLTVILNKPTKI